MSSAEYALLKRLTLKAKYMAVLLFFLLANNSFVFLTISAVKTP
jgi:hypothetical protein